ncbi:HNH endonuclease signature motif containing protein [uncultured Williamsia sp.]|uniref:HNH endonuclease signature motif containing protein n=1 Tax=uncultured Williamsia sp. TaxID=259311 RepID=UPI00260544F2|nr:HNH endonuclease signature motif containing protein [uncultured Williamsia sp.]
MSESGTLDTTGVVASLAADEKHSAAELIEILAHCRSITASADYRMLQAASLIHDERCEDHLVAVAEHDSGQRSSVDELMAAGMDHLAGRDPRAGFGPDGLERATAEIGAVLNVPAAKAREIIVAGDVARYRLVFTGQALAVGRIDLAGFLLICARTKLVVDPDLVKILDTHIAQALFERPPLSRARLVAMVDAIVAMVDPDALVRRKERAAADRDVTIRPDRFQPGASRMSASLPMVDAAAIDARLTAMAGSVHTGDPRTRAQRRADALIALAAGHDHLICGCDTCTTTVDPDAATPVDVDVDAMVDLDHADTPDDAPASTPAGDTPSPAAAEPPAPQPIAPPVGPVRPVFHIVVNLSTLLGLDDHPGYLDGRGIIDADTMRALLADAHREFLRRDDPARAAASASTYVPSKKLATLIRCSEICCTFPGCSAPAWNVDLDHTDPFDHRDPGHGGQTTRANLKPLCRFHHRTKTFNRAWRDYQSPLGEAFFQSPTGHMFLGNAYTALDIFPALGPPGKPEKHPARTTLDQRRATARAAHQRAVERAEEADPPPF